MPIGIYVSLLGRCPLDSREYAVLKTSVIAPHATGVYMVEILCDADDGKLLLERARLFYPGAAPYIEEALEGSRRI